MYPRFSFYPIKNLLARKEASILREGVDYAEFSFSVMEDVFADWVSTADPYPGWTYTSTDAHAEEKRTEMGISVYLSVHKWFLHHKMSARGLFRGTCRHSNRKTGGKEELWTVLA